MQFSYSNKRLYINLILGILWIGIGLSYFFENEKIRWNAYATLILGIVYITMFLYEYTQKYFEITKEKIIIKSIPNKEISLNQITEVKYYADDFTFRSPKKTLKIVKSQINKKQLTAFENFFNNLNTELKKNVV
ncbi:hypothetical protein EGI11_00015 [Chryseobacterium sp. H3056]|uniref:Uncharacterized protein n=1 Tax=Kaistella daneshvariae TaxID=2487074 RepID=A0A3N0WYY3_9FLAO|nr:hypothetical protein [Kaistella daneshvariae]ROI10334.1 hypothetical protein EGI11_00015 [Kaistella daneshvariae]